MARWFEVKVPVENNSIWAPNDSCYLLNISHPILEEEYKRVHIELGVPARYPLSDTERVRWEIDMIRKYGRYKNMPIHVAHRLLMPPYSFFHKPGSDIAAIANAVIKKSYRSG